MALLIAGLCTVFAASVSVWHLRRVWSVGMLDAGALLGVLRGADRRRVEQLMRAMDLIAPTGWERELVQGALAAADRRAAVAVVNEVLLDVDGALRRGEQVPATCVRIALFGALFGVAVAIAGEARAGLEIFDVVAVGGGGLGVALSSGVEARRAVKAHREGIDALVDRLMATLWATEGAGQPKLRVGDGV